MDAHTLVSLFGQDAGAPIALNQDGTAALAFENGPTLNLEHDPGTDSLQCYIIIGQAPADAERRQTVFRQLLAANLFCRDTDGATLGLDDITGELVLSRRLELSRADTAWLRTTIESMVAVASEWQQRLCAPSADAQNRQAPAATDSALPPESMPGFGLRV